MIQYKGIMILRVIKTVEIDTSYERKRIDKCFKRDKDTQKHLHELMDLIEECKWVEAHNLLCTDWWKEYDPKGEHSRLEFIGGLHGRDGNWIGNIQNDYLSLIEKMLVYPNEYKAEQVKE